MKMDTMFVQNVVKSVSIWPKKVIVYSEYLDEIKHVYISRYTYYKTGISKINSIVNKTKRSERWTIKNRFDSNLFNIIYPELGWDINCNCPYYREWKKSMAENAI